MKNLIYCIVLLMFTSCMTTGMIERNCDKFLKVCTIETVKETILRDTTIYRNDTIEVELPSDTVEILETVTIRENLAYLPTTHKEFGIIGVDAGVDKSELHVIAYIIDSTFLYPVHDTIFLEGVIKEVVITNVVPEKYIPGFYKFTFYLFIIVFIIGLVIVVVWIVTKQKYLPLWNTLKKLKR